MSERKLVKMATANLNAENKKEQIDFEMDALLRKKGWESTSSTPGSLWLWQKTLKDGRTVLVNKNSAIHMQCWFDEYGDA